MGAECRANPRAVNMVGERFGRLLVSERAGTVGGKSAWLCLCDCGGHTVTQRSNLTSGHTQSCGCLCRERSAAAKTTHGQSGSALHTVWRKMVERCVSPNCAAFKWYGARGISVCAEWRSFSGFSRDMGPGWRPGLKLDRMNNDGNYEPSNCRWVTPRVNARNTRANRIISHAGFTGCVADVAEHFGVDPQLVRERLSRGWDTDRALEQSVRRVRKGRRGA